MTEVIEVQGKSLEDALQKAQAQLGIEKDDMEYEVIDSGSKGILGIIGAKSALIKAWKRQASQGAAALEFLQPIFEQLGVHPLCNEEMREGILWLSFSGNGMGRVIGRRGETLDALQYLTNLAVNGRREDKIRIILDVEGYRQSREETLAALAKKNGGSRPPYRPQRSFGAYEPSRAADHSYRFAKRRQRADVERRGRA